MVSIKEFIELRKAGYTVDQIKEYSSFIESPAPEQNPDPKPEQKPDPKPEQKPDPKPEQKPDPKPEELLQQILNAVRQGNVNNSSMPEQHTRDAGEILAEIINPKKGRDPK